MEEAKKSSLLLLLQLGDCMSQVKCDTEQRQTGPHHGRKQLQFPRRDKEKETKKKVEEEEEGKE